MLDLVGDPSTRYRIERAMFHGRYSVKGSSYTTPQLHPRPRPEVLARAQALAEKQLRVTRVRATGGQSVWPVCSKALSRMSIGSV